MEYWNLFKNKVFYIVFFFGSHLAYLEAQTATLEVEDQFGFPIANAEITLSYVSESSVETYRTDINGKVKIISKFKGLEIPVQPYVKFTIKAKGYKELTRSKTWKGDITLTNIQLEEESAYSKIRQNMNSRKTEIINKIAIVETTMKSDNLKLPQNIDKNVELIQIRQELEDSQVRIQDLIKESSKHSQEASDYKTKFEDIDKKYNDLTSRYDAVVTQFNNIQDNLSVELSECKCLGWGDDYLTLEIKMIDGRYNKVLTSNESLAVGIEKEGKNNSSPLNFTFKNKANPDITKFYFETRSNSDGSTMVLINNFIEKEALEKNINALTPFNYRITFYNTKLFEYRRHYKVPIGVFLIKNLSEQCGKKQKLPKA
jgi:archaellum component FlaC